VLIFQKILAEIGKMKKGSCDIQKKTTAGHAGSRRRSVCPARSY